MSHLTSQFRLGDDTIIDAIHLEIIGRSCRGQKQQEQSQKVKCSFHKANNVLMRIGGSDQYRVDKEKDMHQPKKNVEPSTVARSTM